MTENVVKLKLEGNKLLQQHKYTQSIQKYSLAIQLDPENAILYCNRSAAYSFLKQFNKSATDAKKAIELNAQYGKAYSRLGYAYQNLHKYRQAIVQYKLSLNHSLSPNLNSFVNKQINICLEKLNYTPSDNTKLFMVYAMKYLKQHIRSMPIDLSPSPLSFMAQHINNIIIELVPKYNKLFPKKKVDTEQVIEYLSIFGMKFLRSKNLINSNANAPSFWLDDHIGMLIHANDNQMQHEEKEIEDIKIYTTKTVLFPKLTLSSNLTKILQNKTNDEISAIAIRFFQTQQYNKALSVYKYLCNLNHIDSIYMYGVFYLVGNIHVKIQQNEQQAYIFFEYVLLLDATYAPALYYVALFHYEGTIVKRNYKKAFDLLRSHVRNKNVKKYQPCYQLISILYFAGYGTLTNLRLAQKYQNIAKVISDAAGTTTPEEKYFDYGLNHVLPIYDQRELDLRWDTAFVYLKKRKEKKFKELKENILTMCECADVMQQCGVQLIGYDENVMKDIKCTNGYYKDMEDVGIKFTSDPSFDWNNCKVKKCRLCGGCDRVIKWKVYRCRNCDQTYCSRKCQKYHWNRKSHKEMCKVVENVNFNNFI
eukprot:165026_1